MSLSRRYGVFAAPSALTGTAPSTSSAGITPASGDFSRRRSPISHDPRSGESSRLRSPATQEHHPEPERIDRGAGLPDRLVLALDPADDLLAVAVADRRRTIDAGVALHACDEVRRVIAER